MNKKLFVLSLPTGIGAEYGGYAGDMGYIAREFANHFDLNKILDIALDDENVDTITKKVELSKKLIASSKVKSLIL